MSDRGLLIQVRLRSPEGGRMVGQRGRHHRDRVVNRNATVDGTRRISLSIGRIPAFPAKEAESVWSVVARGQGVRGGLCMFCSFGKLGMLILLDQGRDPMAQGTVIIILILF